ncbi:hypothetical protein K7432_002185 [Basidiobolus ranarum]|uniref:Transmembrane protein n=1 Tax=Basidiobolus ranarum TaxID=34480 RepID=A0ABR2X269_9FUNG
MGLSLSRNIGNPENRSGPFPLSITRSNQQPESENNVVNQEAGENVQVINGFDTLHRADPANPALAVDGDQALWDKLVSIRASREILTARLRLFVRISILFVVLILVLGVDPLRLPWWLVFIPMVLMILNLVFIATLKSRVRTLDREEVTLLQSMGRVEMGQDIEATYLPPPPPTYATAAAQPPAYLNPLITPSYASLLPNRARSNQNLREERPSIPPPSHDNNHISIEMTQASSSSSGLVAPITQRKTEES